MVFAWIRTGAFVFNPMLLICVYMKFCVFCAAWSSTRAGWHDIVNNELYVQRDCDFKCGESFPWSIKLYCVQLRLFCVACVRDVTHWMKLKDKCRSDFWSTPACVMLVVAYYLVGPSNCIASNSCSSLCGFNACEELINEIEGQVQGRLLRNSSACVIFRSRGWIIDK